MLQFWQKWEVANEEMSQVVDMTGHNLGNPRTGPSGDSFVAKGMRGSARTQLKVENESLRNNRVIYRSVSPISKTSGGTISITDIDCCKIANFLSWTFVLVCSSRTHAKDGCAVIGTI